MSRAALFLDRDGVLNEIVRRDGVVSSPWRCSEFVVLPGVASAVAHARRLGFLPVVVTNQPDLARGNLAATELHSMHAGLQDLGIEHVYVCGHERHDGCPCRKPRPGMLFTAAAELGLDLGRSWMIGDRWVDIAAGHAAGVRTALVRHADSWVRAGGQEPPPGLAAEVEAPDLAGVLAVITDR